MAGVQETAQWENHVYRIEENDPVHGGENGVTNRPIKHLANRTLWLRKLLTEAGQRITPKKITATSSNSNDLTGHTHEIERGDTTKAGLIQLTNDTGLDSEALALSAKGGKALAQQIAQTQQRITEGLNQKPNKSDISSVVNSESTTQIANSKAVKMAYDKAVEAKTAADGAYQVDRANQNRNLNILLGQNTVWGTANRDGSLTGLESIYNYGVGLAMSAGGANAMLYIPHSHAGNNNGVWVQASFSGNNSIPIWRRIDGTDWVDIRNRPWNVEASLSTRNLNEVTTVGLYGQTADANAIATRNYPTQQAGSLLVTPSAHGVQQEYTTYHSNEKYVRGRTNGTWHDWRMVSGQDKVSKGGDTMTGALKSRHIGHGDYVSQHRSEAPFLVEAIGDGRKGTFHPFIKGKMRSHGNYGGAFSFGWTSHQGDRDGFGKGAIVWAGYNAETINEQYRVWSFETNGDFISAGDVQSSGGKSLNQAVMLSDISYQKIGNFEIRKYPDGTMIQTCRFTPQNNRFGVQMSNNNTLIWPIAFYETPKVWAQYINTDSNEFGSTDSTISINHRNSNKTKVVFSVYEIYHNNLEASIDFLAIGRWK